MKERPDDFSIYYSWREGSLPPPYHYEYSVYLGPQTEGKIVFYPDYPMDKPSAWQESFSIDDKALGELYTLIKEKQLFTRHWNEIEDPPVGGSLEWMEIIAEENHIIIPSAIKESDILDDIYITIRSLVPKEIWAKLMRQYDKYQRKYLENQDN
jgi:hypothetical protein